MLSPSYSDMPRMSTPPTVDSMRRATTEIRPPSQNPGPSTVSVPQTSYQAALFPGGVAASRHAPAFDCVDADTYSSQRARLKANLGNDPRRKKVTLVRNGKKRQVCKQFIVFLPFVLTKSGNPDSFGTSRRGQQPESARPTSKSPVCFISTRDTGFERCAYGGD